jgi:hypothetical protein
MIFSRPNVNVCRTQARQDNKKGGTKLKSDVEKEKSRDSKEQDSVLAVESTQEEEPNPKQKEPLSTLDGCKMAICVCWPRLASSSLECMLLS